VNASAPGAAQAPARRAGRNLPAAIGVGLGLAAVLLLSLFVRPVAFVVVAAVAVVVGCAEVAHAFRTRHLLVPVLPVAAGGVAMVFGAYFGGSATLFVGYALTVLAVLLWRLLLPGGDHGSLSPGLGARDVAAGVFLATYVPLLAGFAALMLRASDGPWRVLLFVLLPVASDVGGYAAGVFFGKHPMAPSVSPKKSWEGLVGSFAVGGLAGAVVLPLALHGPWWGGVLVGVATVAVATLGDLAESMLKRDLGIKDMGSLLPGHGGVMDRLDSLLPAAPVVHLLLLLIIGS
jgi:phosphatidate cytidylyltransferase